MRLLSLSLVLAGGAVRPVRADEAAQAQVTLVGATREVPPVAQIEFVRPFDGRPSPAVAEAKTQASGVSRGDSAAAAFALAPELPARAGLATSPTSAPIADVAPAGAQIRITGSSSTFHRLPPVTPAAAAEPIEGQPQLDRRIYRPITQLTVDAAQTPGPLPETEEPLPADSPARVPEFGDGRVAGAWPDAGLEWAASAMCHGPLYFEEVNLERYGYGCHPLLQPAVSSAHFFLTIPALPYKMATDCPGECVYTLGYYRPGSCVPWQRNWPKWSVRGGMVEAATAVGLVFLIP